MNALTESDRPLAGKTALVTGGAKRLGRELALALAEAGANVAVAYRESAAEATKTARDVEARGVRSVAFGLDVRSEESCRLAVATTADIFGGLDLLINNAAVFEPVEFDQISLAQWDRMLETNTRGPFLMAREALPYLRAARGRIINLGSLGGSHAWATHAHYCSSKAGLHMLTQVMAKAFAPDITVNCVAPGYIDMPPDREAAKHFAARTPMGRNGVPGDVAAAVLFFATGPSFITGQILNVDGGLGL
jgi:3-oxoacyl-[acyl-carrier protein] reductase/pteridine reductase